MVGENNLLGMKSISEAMSVPIGTTIKNYIQKVLKLSWCFSSWFEKIMLLAMMSWSLYSIIKFVGGLF